MNTKRKHYTYLLLIIAIGVSIKNIFTNFNIDSAFQLVMDYRWTQGDHYFAQMWEPYMMSTFLTAPFVKLYTALIGTTGIVIFMQLIGVLIKAAVCYVLYRVVVRFLGDRDLATAMVFLFFLVYPKDLPFAEYSNMEMYFTLLLGLSLFAYLQSESKWQLLLSAVWMCCLVLSYPSNLLVAVAAFFILLGYRGLKSALAFTGTCILGGIAYILLILRNISIAGLKQSIHGMLAIETSHSATFGEKMWLYFLDFYKYALVFIALHLVAWGVVKLTSTAHHPHRHTMMIDSIYLLLVVIFAIYVTVKQAHYTKFCYAALFFALMLVARRYRCLLDDKARMLYRILSIFGLLNFISTILLTNLKLAASFSYLLVGAVGALIPIGAGLKHATLPKHITAQNTENDSENQNAATQNTENSLENKNGVAHTSDQKIRKTTSRGLNSVTVVAIYGFLVLRSCILIQPLSGEIPTIFNVRGLVKHGPAVGIVTSYMGAYMQNESYQEWQNIVPEGSKIYLVGDAVDVLGYLYTEDEVAGPSTVPTPGYNEAIAAYWEANPDKYPDVIVASCWYGELALAPDDWMLQYLETTYPATTVVDGKYWRYYIR